jgi:cAMP-dependent protein kinase regulator
LKTFVSGEVFGELALLYNAPRAATITAKTNAHLWVLDRNTFNYIVKDAASRKREKYEEFLKSVSILS